LLELTEPIPYGEAWQLQQQLHAARVNDRGRDTLLLLEHTPVYTLGRGTQDSHFSGIADERVTATQIQAVNRGGSVTYHGPGQLVTYPILRLADYAPGPRHYIRLLETVLIETLRCWNIQGRRVEKQPGVWIQAQGQLAKIASVGVRVDRGVTLHGFALNVEMDLSPFSRITPCGLIGCRMTSMGQALGSSLSLASVRRTVGQTFSCVFDIEWTHIATGTQLMPTFSHE
jgi:lipoate-protein ligase B